MNNGGELALEQGFDFKEIRKLIKKDIKLYMI
ncbi:MAG: hypothetical protein CM15mP102_20730 [Flavobacteriales bacterium]|nr:MAG: hypothetical protein CM15mP102_20730 [Flavobacteriales bacterium]